MYSRRQFLIAAPLGVLGAIAAGRESRVRAAARRFGAAGRTVYNVMDPAYGAVGDGVTDDSAAIAACIAAANAHSTILFPAGHTFVWDREIYVRTPGLELSGYGATVKLPAESKLFNERANLYTRYMLHICADDVSVRGLHWDGNSRNNSYTGSVTLASAVAPGDTTIHVSALAYAIPTSYTLTFMEHGVARTVTTAAAAGIGATTIPIRSARQAVAPGSSATVEYYLNNGHSVGMVLAGFYGASPKGQTDLHRITIADNTFFDSPQLGFDTYQQGFRNTIHDLKIVNNTFRYCQGGQCTFSCVTNGVCQGNTFLSPYFCAFQYYYANTNCQFSNNTIRSSVAALHLAKVDPSLYTGALLNFSNRAIYLGKTDAHMNTHCDATNNRLYGCGIALTQGTTQCSITGNRIYDSESTGIDVIADGTGTGNVVSRNEIYDCDQAGLYLDGVRQPVLVEDNFLQGNGRQKLSPTYGGRQLDAQIYIWSPTYVLRHNTVRRGASTVKYGVLGDKPNIEPDTALNDFHGSGTVQDAGSNTGVHPPVLARRGRGSPDR